MDAPTVAEPRLNKTVLGNVAGARLKNNEAVQRRFQNFLWAALKPPSYGKDLMCCGADKVLFS